MAATAIKETGGEETAREAVGVFHDVPSFEAAVDELMESGFDRADLSLLASEQAVVAKLGHRYAKVKELEDAIDAPRAAYVDRESVAAGQVGVVGALTYIGALAAAGAVVASGGTLATAVIGAALAGGSGGLIGTAVARLLGRHHAGQIDAQLSKGGVLLWVRVRDDEHETRALAILRKNGAEDVHAHDIPKTFKPEPSPIEGVEIDPFLPGARI